MTRKDTILIAVVINAGLLAILFATAIIYDTDEKNEESEFIAPIVANKQVAVPEEPKEVLNYYHPPQVDVEEPVFIEVPIPVLSPVIQVAPAPRVEEVAAAAENMIEIKVKSGDTLDKIAKANRTSVEAIKRINRMESERLAIGQVLKVPVSSQEAMKKEPVKKETVKPEPVKKTLENNAKGVEPVYYVIKKGDNPWKIARQFDVKEEDILRLNNIDKEKARNLKIGERIRIK